MDIKVSVSGGNFGFNSVPNPVSPETEKPVLENSLKMADFTKISKEYKEEMKCRKSTECQFKLLQDFKSKNTAKSGKKR